MTVGEYIESGLVSDQTTVFITDKYNRLLTKGKWYEDNILSYINRKVVKYSPGKSRIILCVN